MFTYAAEKNWECDADQIDELIAAATARLVEVASSLDTEAETGRSISRLNSLYQLAVKVDDVKSALAVQKELNKILQIEVKRQAGKVAELPAAKLRIVK